MVRYRGQQERVKTILERCWANIKVAFDAIPVTLYVCHSGRDFRVLRTNLCGHASGDYEDFFHKSAGSSSFVLRELC